MVSYRLRVRVAGAEIRAARDRRAGHRRARVADAVKGTRERVVRWIGNSTRRSTNATALISARPSRDRRIVEQFDATTVIPPGWNGRVDGYGNLILARA